MDSRRNKKLGYKYIVLFCIGISIWSCKDDAKPEIDEEELAIVETPDPVIEFGFNLDNYIVKRDIIEVKSLLNTSKR